MQRLVYVPPGADPEDRRKSVILAAQEPFILSDIKGVGGVACDVIASEVVGMDGSVYHGRRKKPREIPCTVYVHGNSREDMYRKRLELIGKLRAEDVPGTLYYSNDHISVKTAAVPIIPPDFVKRIKTYNQADIRLWCPSPDWIALQSKSSSIAAQEGTGFMLPFSFPISFTGIRNRISVENGGTAPAPVTITINGPGIEPSITNLTNGKTIALENKTLDEDEQLIINTQRGQKSVRLLKDGVYTDGFQYIKPDSVFWELEPGLNDIIYSSADDAQATRIVIEWTERYEGV